MSLDSRLVTLWFLVLAVYALTVYSVAWTTKEDRFCQLNPERQECIVRSDQWRLDVRAVWGGLPSDAQGFLIYAVPAFLIMLARFLETKDWTPDDWARDQQNEEREREEQQQRDRQQRDAEQKRRAEEEERYRPGWNA